MAISRPAAQAKSNFNPAGSPPSAEVSDFAPPLAISAARSFEECATYNTSKTL
jgi:hypothetical protein